MGSSSSRGPKTEKLNSDGSANFLRYGLCEMQGWRGYNGIKLIKN